MMIRNVNLCEVVSVPAEEQIVDMSVLLASFRASSF